ncbi:MAG: hypothetical protein K2O55_01520 [Alistipes sp.]|nr:hypothetical protein [Alistipes sp.]MDE7077246.1 hypothetical protein [Alistipes sp.]
MKRLLLIMILSTATLLAACESEYDRENPLTPTQGKAEELMNGYDGHIDMTAFLETVQQGVWLFDTLDITYTNGETYDGIKDGSREISPMMLLPGGECRVFLRLMFNPLIPMLYQKVEWSVSEQRANTLELYSEEIERSAETTHYDQYAARTTLELLYYQDGIFIMKGMQPFAYGGGMTSQGIYKDYCTIVGHIATDKETVEKYRACEFYDEYRAQHPDQFPDK